MPRPFRIGVLLTVCALTAAFAERAFAQTDDAVEFVPGEILVGFDAPQDREALVSRLDRTRQSIRAGGEAPATLTPERLGGATLKLKVEFAASVQSRLSGDPSAELQALEQVAEQIKTNNGNITYAHPNWIVRLDPVEQMSAEQIPSPADAVQQEATPNDPIYKAGMQWHYGPLPGGMNAEAAWKAGITGNGDIVVAVLDTGMAFDHSDMAGSRNVSRGISLLSHNNCTGQDVRRSGDGTDTGNACPEKGIKDSSFHGSHVAGTIGAAITNNGKGVAGVNWNVTVVPVRVLGPAGGTLSDAADGVLWASGHKIDGVPNIAKRADVINMSLGGYGECNQANYGVMIAAIEQARKAGTVVVVSAGNGTTLDTGGRYCRQSEQNKQTCTWRQVDFRKFWPAACRGVISVAANGPTGNLAPYSNFGPVSIMAPGGDRSQSKEFEIFGKTMKLGMGVWSLSDSSYSGMEGTSMAAPHVSGAIALAMSKDPSLRGKPDEVARRLRASAVRTQPGACQENKPCGPGQLDVMRLINQR